MTLCDLDFAGWLMRIAVVGGLALSASTQPAMADEPTQAMIIDSLAETRSPPPPGRNSTTDDRWLIDVLRQRSTRSLTAPERQQVATVIEHRPRIDLEINFKFDSAVLAPEAVPMLVTLGRALSDRHLRNNVILIEGHTDAQGSDHYNQSLAERRANSVKRFLVANFELAPEKLLAIGLGRQQPKNKTDLLAPENRRVRIVKLTSDANTERH